MDCTKYNTVSLMLAIMLPILGTGIAGRQGTIIVRNTGVLILAVSTSTILCLPKLVALRAAEKKRTEIQHARAIAQAVAAAGGIQSQSAPALTLHIPVGAFQPFQPGQQPDANFEDAAADLTAGYQLHCATLAANAAAAAANGDPTKQQQLKSQIQAYSEMRGSRLPPIQGGGGDAVGGGGGVVGNGLSSIPVVLLSEQQQQQIIQQQQQQQQQQHFSLPPQEQSDAFGVDAFDPKHLGLAGIRQRQPQQYQQQQQQQQQRAADVSLLQATCQLLDEADVLPAADLQRLHSTLLRRVARTLAPPPPRSDSVGIGSTIATLPITTMATTAAPISPTSGGHNYNPIHVQSSSSLSSTSSSSQDDGGGSTMGPSEQAHPTNIFSRVAHSPVHTRGDENDGRGGRGTRGSAHLPGGVSSDSIASFGPVNPSPLPSSSNRLLLPLPSTQRPPAIISRSLRVTPLDHSLPASPSFLVPPGRSLATSISPQQSQERDQALDDDHGSDNEGSDAGAHYHIAYGMDEQQTRPSPLARTQLIQRSLPITTPLPPLLFSSSTASSSSIRRTLSPLSPYGHHAHGGATSTSCSSPSASLPSPPTGELELVDFRNSGGATQLMSQQHHLMIPTRHIKFVHGHLDAGEEEEEEAEVVSFHTD